MNKFLKSKIIERFGCQADFAVKAGVNESLVSRVIRGRRKLNKDEQAKWARILKTGKEVFHNDIARRLPRSARKERMITLPNDILILMFD